MLEGKRCYSCKQHKSYENYCKNKGRKDGYNDLCKPCKSESDKRSYQKNKEKRAISRKKYYEENKKAFLENCKEYRDSNKEKISEYKKEWHKRNKEVVNERSKKWREENKEQNVEVKKKWYRKNRDRVYANILKRKSEKFHVRFYGVKRKSLLDRDNWECQSCGVQVHDKNTGGNENRHLWDDEFKAHIDHIIPISKGGDSTPENLQVLCRTCNLSKRATTEYEISKSGQIKLTL